MKGVKNIACFMALLLTGFAYAEPELAEQAEYEPSQELLDRQQDEYRQNDARRDDMIKKSKAVRDKAIELQNKNSQFEAQRQAALKKSSGNVSIDLNTGTPQERHQKRVDIINDTHQKNAQALAIKHANEIQLEKSISSEWDTMSDAGDL